MSDESIINPATSCNSFAPKLTYIHNSKMAPKYEGSCLEQNTEYFDHRSAMNLFILLTLDSWSWDLNADFTVKDCLFWAAKLTKNADPEKYADTRYGIEILTRVNILLSLL